MCNALGERIPASVIVRAVLNSSLAAKRKSLRSAPFGDGLADAARDLFSRSLRPQLEMVGYAESQTRHDPAFADCLVRDWLKLRFGTPEERNAVADALPEAAREARQSNPVRPRWRDFAEWNRRWHHPPRLARAAVIAVDGDAQAHRTPLATPLVLEAGVALGPNVRRIRTVSELIALGHEEEHCIASYAIQLRTGDLHCLVLEDRDTAARPRRSTVLLDEYIQDPESRGLHSGVAARLRPVTWAARETLQGIPEDFGWIAVDASGRCPLVGRGRCRSARQGVDRLR